MADLPELDPVEQRVLGCLLEKQSTVPSSYPLSLNALRTACNQATSRDPVVEYDDRTIQDAARALKDRHLLRLVWAGAGSRTVKYHQLLDEVLGLDQAERALMTVLLLRGAQTAGELNTRTDRLHAFSDKAEVLECLTRMAALEPPLVRELPIRSGREHRWIHLLGPLPPAEPVREDERESVLRDGPAARDVRVLAAYEAVAPAYAEQLLDELTEKPFDIWLLERVAELTTGPVMDLGCGPGHIAAFLADLDLDVHGLDASPAMVEQAHANFPDLDVTVGTFDRLLRPRTASAWGAILAWYAFVHLAPSELAPTIRGVASTLAPDGLFVLALHVGDDVTHVDDLCGVPVDVEFVLHDRDQVIAAVAQAGLQVQEWYVRSPNATEAATTRLYLVARASPEVR